MGILLPEQVRPTYSILKLITASCCLVLVCATSAIAADGEGSSSKIAVIAVVTGEGQSDTLKIAEGVGRDLSKYEKYEVISADEVRRLLGGPGAIGAATEDLEKQRSLYQDAYLKSYSFKYDGANEQFKAVLKGLEKAPDSSARWDLYVKTHIYMGKSYLGMKSTNKAIESFRQVLRTRPDMTLSKKEHPLKDIKIWEKALLEMYKAKKGKLVLDTEPTGVEVFLDGAKVGVTPFIRTYPLGKYHLKLHHKATGISYARWMEVTEEMHRTRIDLAFESSLKTGLAYPAIKHPEGKNKIPPEWWPWLRERLGLNNLAIVSMESIDGEKRIAVSIIDLQKVKLVRCMMLSDSLNVDRASTAIAEYIATGKGSAATVFPAFFMDKTEKRIPGDKETMKAGTSKTIPSVEVRTTTAKDFRPWHRKWWPYAVAGTVILAGGVAANLVANDYYDDNSGLASKKDAADIWMGVAITGYALSGAAILTGILLHVTYEPRTSTGVAPAAFSKGFGIQVFGSF